MALLEIKPNCENCGRALPNGSDHAMICSFECTFCDQCVHEILHNVCPNCGGGFVPRPVRPAALLGKYPPGTVPHIAPVDMTKFAKLLEKNRNIPPNER